MSTLHNLVGIKFGKLTVTSRGPNTRGGKPSWNCLCDCGGRKTASAANLKKGTTRSCGCLRQDPDVIEAKRKHHLKPPGTAAFNSVLYRYVTAARKRELVWELTDEQVKNLIFANCHYCGRAPSQAPFTGRRAKYNDAFKYNGIDRKDNTAGYVLSNCLPCCQTCNWAKGAMTYTEFIEYIDRLIKHRGGV